MEREEAALEESARSEAALEASTTKAAIIVANLRNALPCLRTEFMDSLEWYTVFGLASRFPVSPEFVLLSLESGAYLAPGFATHAHQRAVVADALPFPSCGMALVPFGGNKIALSTITRIVNPSTTNTRTAGRPEIEPYPSLGNGMLL
jgi:hypothetical protein